MAGRTILLALFLLLCNEVVACEGCGCSVSSNGLGLLSAYQFNSVGMRYFHTPFKSTLEYGEGTMDDFHTLEINLRYHISPRIKINFQQPYKINVRKDVNGQRKLKGLSDTRLIGSYTLFNNKAIGESGRFYLELGAGVKLPVGQYDAKLHDKNFPENFNPGNGSWAGIFQSNLIYSHQQIGFIWNTFYQANSNTRSGYHFGNQLASNFLIFWKKDVKQLLEITPFSGLSFEQVAKDTYANQNEVQSTSGKGVFLSSGLHLKFDRFLLGGSYAIPMGQSYSDDDVQAKARLSIECSFLF